MGLNPLSMSATSHSLPDQFPLPPPGRTGWPWTEASPPLSPTRSDGSLWPRVSVVTPSFNQAPYLEETIRSVLLQGYPNLEYIVMDGGSTDGSVEIIRRYADWVAAWVSERDAGQADAINKGFRHASGEILAWLNSDDIFYPGAVQAQVKYLIERPTVEVVYGDCQYVSAHGQPVQTAYARPFAPRELLRFTLMYQPTVFFRRAAMERSGPLDAGFQFALDAEYWLRLHRNGARFGYHPALVATYRLHDSSKTIGSVTKMHAETERLIVQYASPGERVGLLADHYLQTAIRLVNQGQTRSSWAYARAACALRVRIRLLAYLGAVFDQVTGLPLYRSMLGVWLRLKSRV